MYCLRYPFRYEIRARHGMFADPGSGSESGSLPVPTPSAIIGMTDNIYRIPGVKLTVVAVGLCKRPVWVPYNYNSRNVLRKETNLKEDQACQQHESVLQDPHYQILGFAETVLRQHNSNPAHAFQEILNRRLSRGRNNRCPTMGRANFLCTYVGPVQTPVDQSITDIPAIPFMLTGMFDAAGNCKPTFTQNLHVERGVLAWYPEFSALDGDGFLTYKEPARD